MHIRVERVEEKADLSSSALSIVDIDELTDERMHEGTTVGLYLHRRVPQSQHNGEANM
jgi:hypothetical protein